jgi:hypothetical protein
MKKILKELGAAVKTKKKREFYEETKIHIKGKE